MKRSAAKTLIVLASIVTGLSVIPESAIANNQLSFQIAQGDLSAQQLYQAGSKLFQQGTPATFQQALEKFEAALKHPSLEGDLKLQAALYQNIGAIHSIRNDYAKALQAQNQALNRFETLQDQPGLATQLALTAITHYNLGNYDEAIRFNEQSLAMINSTQQLDLKPVIYMNLGNIYQRLGKIEQAIASLQSALELHQSQGNIQQQVKLWQQIAAVHLDRAETPKATEALDQALALSRRSQDVLGEAETLWLLGTVANTAGDYATAIPNLEKSHRLYQQLSTSGSGFTLTQAQQGLITVTLSYAIALEAVDRADSAAQMFQEALDLSRQQDNLGLLAEALNFLGFFQSRQGMPRKAIATLQEALQIQRSSQNLPRAAITLENMGRVYLALGEPQKALDTYQKALGMQRDLGDRKQEGAVLRVLGDFYRQISDYPIAIQYYQQALTVAQSLDDPLLQGQSLNDLGEVYRQSGNLTDAIASYNKAVDVWRSQQNAFQIFNTSAGLIRALAASQRFPEARQATEQALRIAEQSESLFQQGILLSSLGRVEIASQQYTDAIAAFQSAQQKLSQGGYDRAEASSQFGLGEALEQNGNLPEAIAAYQESLAFFRQANDPVEIADSLYRLARVERAQSNFSESKRLIEECLQIVEGYRSKLVSPDLRSRYFASVQTYYEFYIDLLMQQHQQQPNRGYDALALAANERAKARSLLDLLVESNIDIRQGVDPQLLEQERSLQQQISRKDQEWREINNTPDSQASAQSLQNQIQQLLVQYDTVQTQLRQSNPSYAALTSPAPITLSDIQQTILDEQTALLAYSLGEERSYLWVVTQTDLKSHVLPSRQEVETAARQFYNAVTNRTLAVSGIPSQAAEQTLSAMILPSALQVSQKRLLIVGDGMLQYIPFAALPSQHLSQANPSATLNRLIERHEIVTLPSASTLSSLRQSTQNQPVGSRSIAIAADPVFSSSDPRLSVNSQQSGKDSSSDLNQRLVERAASGFSLSRLPGTRIEAEQILKISNQSENFVALDFDANLRQVQSRPFEQSSIVHLATHGIANDQNPELSGLFLSLLDAQGNPQPGFLTLNQIFNLNWPSDLVVLSACETGLGETIRGEGLVSLTRGFMYAGAKRVLVSQWAVDDTGTQQLISAFYDKLFNDELTPAAALRAAQLQLANDIKWRSPYYWAAFTLQGDW